MMTLPTKEQCDEIVAANKAFYRIEAEVNDHKVHAYHYIRPSIDDFMHPLPGVDVDALELRGLTFVSQGDGDWQRWPMLRKFFNVGEVPGYEKETLSAKQLTGAQVKLDGSLIHFVKVGRQWLAKTKKSFSNKQAEAANALKTFNLEIFLERCYEMNVTPIFEYVSPENQIVVNYGKSKLVLIQTRGLTTGKHLDPEPHMDIPVARAMQVTFRSLDHAIQVASELKDSEGFVLNFGGEFAKVKSPWYLDLHKKRELFECSDRYLFSLVISDKFDDVFAQLPEHWGNLKADLKAKASKIDAVYTEAFHGLHKTLSAHNLPRIIAEPGLKKVFVDIHKDNPYFHALMKSMAQPESLDKNLSDLFRRKFRTDKAIQELLNG